MAVSDGLLQLDPLLASARAKAGLDDFVDEEFIEPLTHLLAAYRSEADFSAQGAQAMHGHLVDALVTRLRIHHCVKLHPEILQEEIRGPLVILGLPRTGTTKLQRLLGSSPHMQKLPFWKLLTPVPLDDVSSNASDPRIALAEQFVAGMKHRT